jgi:3-hydroxyisobutyrate dehydrogenase-like beta-hydroxyacid dehydrogenase
MKYRTVWLCGLLAACSIFSEPVGVSAQDPDAALPSIGVDGNRLVDEAGGSYLDGAIMVPTPMIGDDDALLVFSGDEPVFERHRATLSAFAGQLQWLGEDPGLAAVYDLGMLDLYLTGMAGFLHAAALVEAEGVPVASFLPFATGITDVLRDTLPGLAEHVAARSYPGDEDSTAMELAVADHVLETSRARGIGTDVPDMVRALLQRAVDTGHADDSFSSIVEQFRATRDTT